MHPVASASALVRRPRQEVFDFHTDTANLTRVLPLGLIRPEGPSELQLGRVISLVVGRGPLTFRGSIAVEELDPPNKFVDVQRVGPFALWRHTHLFEELGAFTRVTDTVQFRLVPPLRVLEGAAVPLVHALLVAKLLRTARVLARPEPV